MATTGSSSPGVPGGGAQEPLTGKGLAEALEGAQVVVDVANTPVWDDAAVMDNPRIAPSRFEDWLSQSTDRQTNLATQRRVS